MAVEEFHSVFIYYLLFVMNILSTAPFWRKSFLFLLQRFPFTYRVASFHHLFLALIFANGRDDSRSAMPQSEKKVFV